MSSTLPGEVHQVGPAGAFALLHRPRPEADGGVAVLMCPPFGWEEMCSYRGRWAWAQALADAGYAAARLDLPGTGDSPGGPEARTLPAWMQAVADGATWLSQATGAVRTVALGIGLGGLVTVLAAQEGAPIDDLVLWGVPRSGKALLRAARAYAAVVAARYPEDARIGEPPEGELDLIGFRLPAGTVDALRSAALDPERLRREPPRRALLIGRDGAGPDAQLAQSLRDAGVQVTEADGAEYALLLGHPQQAAAPAATIARTLTWLADTPTVLAAAPAGSLASEPPTPLRAVSLPAPSAEGVQESPIAFEGLASQCFGLLSRRPGPQSGLVGVWLNAGALHHIGPNRAWVEIARRWAARGIPTVRVDLPDLGEAGGEAPRARSDDSFYGQQRIVQTRAIVDQLAAQGVGERFVLGGLCSGAYWALHAALDDARVRATMLINLYAIVYDEALVAERDTAQSLDALGSRAWRKLLRGQLSPAQLRSGLASVSPARVRRGASHPVERGQRAQLETALDRLRDQGTEVALLLSRGEGLYDQLARHDVLTRGRARWPNLTVEQLPTRDHMVRALWVQRLVHERLDNALQRTLAVAQAA